MIQKPWMEKVTEFVAILILYYTCKNSYYTEKIFDDVRDDKIYLSAFCGTTTTTPSPDFDIIFL